MLIWLVLAACTITHAQTSNPACLQTFTRLQDSPHQHGPAPSPLQPRQPAASLQAHLRVTLHLHTSHSPACFSPLQDPSHQHGPVSGPLRPRQPLTHIPRRCAWLPASHLPVYVVTNHHHACRHHTNTKTAACSTYPPAATSQMVHRPTPACLQTPQSHPCLQDPPTQHGPVSGSLRPRQPAPRLRAHLHPPSISHQLFACLLFTLAGPPTPAWACPWPSSA